MNERGQGIVDSLPVKYHYAEQPNGRYTIFDVPIFRYFSDPTPENQGGRGKVGNKEAERILAGFEEDKKQGYYPRVHIEHQNEDMSNKPGIGFLDNVRLDSEVFYSDITEVPSMFIRPGKILGWEKQTKDGLQAFELPYRSVEYNQDRGKITGLAVLDSQPSYFVFPLLCLADAPDVPNEKQIFQMGRRDKILRFSMKESNSYCFGCANFCGCDKNKTEKITFCANRVERKGVMEENKFEGAAEMPGGAPPAAPQAPAAGGAGDAPPWAQELIAGVNAMKSVLEKLVQTDEEVHSEPDGDEDAAGNEPPGPEEGEGEEPVKANSVAMQLRTQRKQLADMQREIFSLRQQRATETSEQELAAICEENPAINFQIARATLQKFSADSDRRVYLESLRSQGVGFVTHEATKFALNVSKRADDEFMKGVGADSPELQKLAMEAHRAYRDTYNKQNKTKEERQFFSLHKTPDSFVKSVIAQELRDGTGRKCFAL